MVIDFSLIFCLFLDIQNLTDFWMALKASETVIESNQLIQLPKTVFILGNPKLGSSIFIRKCYPPLLSIALSTVQSSNLVILGNPGIGKTFFGYFIMLNLAKSDCTVVYENGKSPSSILFSPNEIKIGTIYDFLYYLYKPETYYIVDGTTPIQVPAKTILLTSPRREVWYQFSKCHCIIRYMPIWNIDETEQCRGKMFDYLSTEEVKSLYKKWGGIPRYILEKAKDVEIQNRLENSHFAVDLNILITAIGNPEALDSAAHRLIHLHVDGDFHSNLYYTFASEYIANLVYFNLYQTKRTELLQFLAVSHGLSAVGVLRGILFERHAHSMISKGGIFRIRELYHPDLNIPLTKTIDKKFDPLQEFLFDNDLDVQASNFYFRPKITNYESVDSFAKPNLLFQITGANKHPCKQNGIHKVLNLLGNPSDPMLFFIVPNDCFQNFKYQKYEDNTGHIMQEPTYKNVKKVKQFVLEIILLEN